MSFPNVPNVPGVPALPRDPTIAIAAITLLTRDLLSGLLGSLAPQWGLYNASGSPVIFAESVISFDYRQDWSVSDYPLEKGAFEAYDKVETPFTARIRFAQSGSESARTAFLDSIAAAAKTLDLYDAVTPEAIYSNVNINHYDYRRTGGQGQGLIIVDVWVTEVRVNATQTFSNVKSPSAAATVPAGVVQPTTPTPAQTKAVTDTPTGAGN